MRSGSEKTEVVRLLARYEKLDKRNQTIRHALEMASLAGRLGHRFEAKVFRTIAIATDPDHRQLGDESFGLARMFRRRSPGSTLAELLAEELDAADRELLVDVFSTDALAFDQPAASLL